MNDILDLHTHTIASGHAYNTLYEMARSAADKGLGLLGITDHAPSLPGTCHAFHFINFKTIPRELFGVKILMGCELNIINYNGKIDLAAHFLKGLDFAIASIHEPCYKSGTIAENTAAYLGAMKNSAVRIIGHPDDGRFPIDYDTLTAAAKEYHVLLEVNSSSLHPQCNRQNTRENYITMLEYCRHYQTHIIIGSDAHCEVDVGNHARVWELLEEIDFPLELVVNSSLDATAAFIPTLNQPFYLGGAEHD